MAGAWTELNTPCYEDGGNCVVSAEYDEPGAAGAAGTPHGALALARARR